MTSAGWTVSGLGVSWPTGVPHGQLRGACAQFTALLSPSWNSSFGRGSPHFDFKMGPTNSVAVLSEEGSVRELGPTGCCLSSFRLQKLQAAGWVTLSPLGRAAHWASRPSLFWGRGERADKRAHAGHCQKAVCLGVPRLRGPSGPGPLQGMPWKQS